MPKDLPPEMWREIFAFACTDDGYTGRALSLVSQRIRLLSRYYKYQSLAVTRAKHILRLYPVLLETPDELRRIRYLFLGTPYMYTDDASDDERDKDYNGDGDDSGLDSDSTSEGSADSSVGEYEFATLTKEESMEVTDDLLFFGTPEGAPTAGPSVTEGPLLPSVVEEVQIAENLFLDVVNRIITMASPSLIRLTLFLFMQIPYGSFLAVPVPLPELRELSVCCRYKTQAIEPPAPGGAVPFPSLESLHIGWGIHKLLLPRITGSAPQLVNLRCPFSSSLFKQVGGDCQDPWQFLSILPRTINNVLVDIDSDDTYFDVHEAQQLELDKHLNPRGRLTVRRQEDIPSAKRDWLGRMAGGPGGWEYEVFVCPSAAVD